MVSKLAEEQISRLKKEGLEPTLKDIIQLNALGLKVELNSTCAEFANLPRYAFLGDLILQEPSVFKRIFIDKYSRMFNDSYITQLCFTCYCLNTPDEELKDEKSIKELKDKVQEFSKSLLPFTERQILGAITYAMSGNDSNYGEEYYGEKKKDDEEDYSRLPPEAISQARLILCQAISRGISSDVQYEVTCPTLEKMIWAASVKDGGKDFIESENGQALGAFYQCYGKIRKRLIVEHQSQ